MIGNGMNRKGMNGNGINRKGMYGKRKGVNKKGKGCMRRELMGRDK